ncbi:hypothetical protein NDU88_002070 [Pleurodeles waltl]|uniref:Uncharacterized protein n=1 Tax=Pleurodeles waltl TaxID=8319 RepID=A0AAV7P8M8_PLEWA|nr:hypothetical protein NDU88_002070 [Pleurodeles waltl]
MDTEAKVREALALLRQAGRLDLLRDGALAPTRPARRASAGVAVAACSPPRVASAGKVRGAASGVGTKGGPGAGVGGFMGGSGLGNPRGLPRERDARCSARAAAQSKNGGRGPRCYRFGRPG